MTSQKVYLGIGSNIDRVAAISKAINLLTDAFGELEISPTFESESVGFDGDNFYNLVVAFSTKLSLEAIIDVYKGIEDQLGRERSGPKFSARTLDIDPLLYGELVCTKPVQLPRDEILENAYVLWPLSIIAANEKHPVTGVSYAKHWSDYSLDTHQQKLWQVETDWD